MDYERNKRYTQKSNTGFWVITLLSIILSSYMAYSNFIDFVNATNQTVTDTYIYLGNPPPEGYQSQKGAAIFNFICGIIFLSLLLSSIISALRKNMKTLFISFAGALFLTLIVFVVNDFFLY